ncbi:MAG: hypothetical protein K1X75_12915 [Leptospirales bacterium]|nr:hypothetical protein [Leptospirales bacterium]
MRRFLFDWSAFLLQPVAILSLTLAFVPLLLTTVLTLAALTALLAALVVALYPRAQGEAADPAARLPGRFTREFLRSHGGTRRAMRSLRMSAYASILSLALYYGCTGYTRWFYVDSLRNDLEPLRQSFKDELRPIEAPAESPAQESSP